MNKFEVVLIFNPDIATSTLKNEIEKIKAKLIDQSAKVINDEDWGLRDLSYNINKFKKAFYRYFQLEISGNYIDSIKKEITQSENYMRHLFVKVKNHQELPTKLNHEKK